MPAAGRVVHGVQVRGDDVRVRGVDLDHEPGEAVPDHLAYQPGLLDHRCRGESGDADDERQFHG